MIQAKFSLEESHIRFLEHCKQHGFRDRSEVVRTALERFSAELDRERLCESAALYAELYEQDDETREWTEAALAGWPA